MNPLSFEQWVRERYDKSVYQITLEVAMNEFSLSSGGPCSVQTAWNRATAFLDWIKCDYAELADKGEVASSQIPTWVMRDAYLSVTQKP